MLAGRIKGGMDKPVCPCSSLNLLKKDYIQSVHVKEYSHFFVYKKVDSLRLIHPTTHHTFVYLWIKAKGRIHIFMGIMLDLQKNGNVPSCYLLSDPYRDY